MDEDLKTLLASLLAKDPDAPLDDDGRQAIMYAMLAMHRREQIIALWKFACSIEHEFKQSHLLHKLVKLAANHALDHDLAEQIARSIPDPYWRFSALGDVAAELLKRAGQYKGFNPKAGSEFGDRGLRLLEEVELGLPHIREDDGDRVTVLWGVGLSLVAAGKLEWLRVSLPPRNTAQKTPRFYFDPPRHEWRLAKAWRLSNLRGASPIWQELAAAT